jgi:hypothetical protein
MGDNFPRPLITFHPGNPNITARAPDNSNRLYCHSHYWGRAIASQCCRTGNDV